MIELSELKKRAKILKGRLARCTLCPRRCQVNRLKGEKGFCRLGKELMVCSFGPHFGEEACLVGRRGSGTIFFSFCNLHCVFCQNYTISQLGEGEITSPEALARKMLQLEKMGCHNINLVTPTHIIPQIVSALVIAVEQGLNLPPHPESPAFQGGASSPHQKFWCGDKECEKDKFLRKAPPFMAGCGGLPIVYNSGGYDAVETLKVLEGIIDIYMPDFKYGEEEVAKKYSQAPDYFEVGKLAIKEMHRQVGDLVVEGGIAQRGLLVRHLILPNNLAGTKKLMHFLAKEISPDTFVNLMDQYRPGYKANQFPELRGGITEEEYQEALKLAREEGLWRFA